VPRSCVQLTRDSKAVTPGPERHSFSGRRLTDKLAAPSATGSRPKQWFDKISAASLMYYKNLGAYGARIRRENLMSMPINAFFLRLMHVHASVQKSGLRHRGAAKCNFLVIHKTKRAQNWPPVDKIGGQRHGRTNWREFTLIQPRGWAKMASDPIPKTAGKMKRQ
jgi:hypothetical protein